MYTCLFMLLIACVYSVITDYKKITQQAELLKLLSFDKTTLWMKRSFRGKRTVGYLKLTLIFYLQVTHAFDFVHSLFFFFFFFWGGGIIMWQESTKWPCLLLNYPQTNNAIVDHVCRRCSNYIFIIDLAHGFNGLGMDNCWTNRETFQ